jgi:hypothetical protein
MALIPSSVINEHFKKKKQEASSKKALFKELKAEG